MKNTHNDKLDKWGIFWSITCAVHCLALPFIAFLAPSLGSYLKHEFFHLILFVIVLPVAFFALWRPRRVHKSNIPVALGGLGLLLLFGDLYLEIFLGHEHSHDLHHSESLITIFGSLLLVSAHIINLKLHKQCCDHNHTHVDVPNDPEEHEQEHEHCCDHAH